MKKIIETDKLIKFAVEDVELATKPLDEKDVLESISELTKTKPEAWSNPKSTLVPCEYHGLIGAAHMAYNDHRPLRLTPDDIWITIAQGFANHINENAEELRHKFVSHEGKEKIIIRRDEFIKNSQDNNWAGAFEEFEQEIAKRIGKSRDLIMSNFSTTGPLEKTISQIVLMDSMQNYFSYGCMTCCGIPSVILTGTVDDWKNIKNKVQALGEYKLEWWTEFLLPVVDEFINARAGKPNIDFWKDFYHLNSGGSGSPDISGHIIKFIPYLNPYESKLQRNVYLTNKNPFKKHVGRGPDHSVLPSALSKVPFEWLYFDTVYDMEFIGGIIGVKQFGDLTVSPQFGWAIQEKGTKLIEDSMFNYKLL